MVAGGGFKSFAREVHLSFGGGKNEFLKDIQGCRVQVDPLGDS